MDQHAYRITMGGDELMLVGGGLLGTELEKGEKG